MIKVKIERNDNVIDSIEERKVIKELIDSNLAINDTPKKELVDCLMGFTKDRMIDLRDAHQLSGMNAGNRKQELAEKLAVGIVENFPEESVFLSSQQYTALLNQDLDGKDAMDFDALLALDFLHPLVEFGWLFVFKEEDQYTLVMPKEIRDAFNSVRKEENYQKSIQRRQKQLNVLNAMTNIYGAFKPDFFVKIWNDTYPKEEIDVTEAMELFALVNALSPWVSFEEPLIYHSRYLTLGSAEKLFKEAQKQPAYVPTKEDLTYYATNLFDTRTSEYKAFNDFLSQNISADVLPFIEDRFFIHTKMNTPADHFMDAFEEHDVVIDNKENEQQLVKLYKEVVQNASKWTTHGHAPKQASKKVIKPKATLNTVPTKTTRRATQPGFNQKRRNSKKIVRKK